MIGDKKAKQVCDTDTSIEYVSQSKDVDIVKESGD
jgi:hypothetical protein